LEEMPEKGRRSSSRLSSGSTRGLISKLETILDETFVWTHDAGQQVSPAAVARSAWLRPVEILRLGVNNPTVSVNGDTAVVRGSSQRQRVLSPDEGSGGTNPFTVFTLTFVNKGGGWKAIAIHTSWP
jgi:hypothetical protein